MPTFPCGHFKVAIEVSGTGPYTAVGILQPYNSAEPLQRVIAHGATESEAVSAAREEASSAAGRMFFDPRYKRYID